MCIISQLTIEIKCGHFIDAMFVKEKKRSGSGSLNNTDRIVSIEGFLLLGKSIYRQRNEFIYLTLSSNCFFLSIPLSIYFYLRLHPIYPLSKNPYHCPVTIGRHVWLCVFGHNPPPPPPPLNFQCSYC